MIDIKIDIKSMETKVAVIFLKSMYAFAYEATHGRTTIETKPSEDLNPEEYQKVLQEIERCVRESNTSYE